MIFPHTVTVHPSQETSDGDGNPVRRPTSAGFPVAAYMQAAGVPDQAPDTTSADYRVWLAADCPRLDASATLVWNGETYDLLGDAQYLTDPDGAIAHWRAHVRRRV